MNIGVIAEILFFLVADRLFRNVSVGTMLATAALGSTIRWLLVFAFPSVAVFSVSQLLHACSFAMGHYAFMQYLIKNIAPKDVPKAQGIYSALALSWSTAVFTLFGGFLYEIDPRYAFGDDRLHDPFVPRRTRLPEDTEKRPECPVVPGKLTASITKRNPLPEEAGFLFMCVINSLMGHRMQKQVHGRDHAPDSDQS